MRRVPGRAATPRTDGGIEISNPSSGGGFARKQVLVRREDLANAKQLLCRSTNEGSGADTRI
jgi:hypothetical protein